LEDLRSIVLAFGEEEEKIEIVFDILDGFLWDYGYSKDDYAGTVVEGSITITFAPEYMLHLGNNEYTLTVYITGADDNEVIPIKTEFEVNFCLDDCTPGDREVALPPTRVAKGAWEIRCEICDELLEEGDIDALKIVGAVTTTRDFVSMLETARNSRIWVLTFDAVVTLADEDGKVVETERVRYTISLPGNNANLDGRYTFRAGHELEGYTLTYDIKGNGSNIRALSLR
jgi:hypothetical protein